MTAGALESAAVLDRDPTEVVPAFSRHETFHPRFGWLKKAYDAAAEDPGIFHRADAPAALGVGKNMVRAMRYWAKAFKILDEVAVEGSRWKELRPSHLGTRLMSRNGWDPFLERAGSLWILHWHLLRPPSFAPSWHFTFNQFRRTDFSEADLFEDLRAHCRRQEEWAAIVDSSIKKDVDCLLRMYAGSSSARSVIEDTIDSPFIELDLIRQTPGSSKHYSFNLGDKPHLPEAVVVYACLDFASRTAGSVRTMGLSSLAYGPGSPGSVFKLTESQLAEAIDEFALDSDVVALADVAGMRRFTVSEDPGALAEVVLKKYFGRRRSRA